jgi:hypothetical protein
VKFKQHHRNVVAAVWNAAEQFGRFVYLTWHRIYSVLACFMLLQVVKRMGTAMTLPFNMLLCALAVSCTP